jgi:hypothetical protein
MKVDSKTEQSMPETRYNKDTLGIVYDVLEDRLQRHLFSVCFLLKCSFKSRFKVIPVIAEIPSL